jgi:hypothetical protein
MTKAILIDPVASTLTEVRYDGLEMIYALLDCHMIVAVPLPDGHAVYVDEEGLDKPNNGLFVVIGSPPLRGKGLLVGPADDEGDTTDCQHTLDWAQKHTGVVTMRILDRLVVVPMQVRRMQ